MAGRKQLVSSAAAAVAAALLLVALLAAAAGAAEDCGINKGKVMSTCLSYCVAGGGGGVNEASRRSEYECCQELNKADFACLCRNYWSELRDSRYASCVATIKSKCGINKSC